LVFSWSAVDGDIDLHRLSIDGANLYTSGSCASHSHCACRDRSGSDQHAACHADLVPHDATDVLADADVDAVAHADRRAPDTDA
jgi:hypothetical protein